MKAINSRIDTSRLKKKANVTGLGEVYETLERSKEYRVGAGIRAVSSKKPKFFLEAVISLCREESGVEIEKLRSKLDIFEEFQKSGYSLRCESDNTVICEKSIKESELEEEYLNVKKILKNSDS